MPVTPSAWTLAPIYEKQPLLPMQPSAHGTRCRSIGTCVLKSFAAEGFKLQRQAMPQRVFGASLLAPWCDERFQVGHAVHNNVCVGLLQDVDSPPDVKRALCGTKGPDLTHRAAHVRAGRGGAHGG